jgi:putative aldouronate transport system permease protein
MGTLISLIVTSAMAYSLSRKYLPYRGIVMKFVFFTMLFSGGLIPYYLLIKNLGLIDKIWSVIITGAVSSWNMILMRNFFMAIPGEIEESALIDGANDILILLRIMIPISKPALATIGLYYAVGYWNNWYGPMLFLNNNKLWPMMLFLKQVVQSANAVNELMIYKNNNIPPSDSIKMAVVVVCTLPILIVYPFLQKYFVKGVMIGSIKG